MFELTKENFKSLRCNFSTLKQWGNLCYAFTEKWAAMVSGSRNSDFKFQINISIMQSFIAIQQVNVLGWFFHDLAEMLAHETRRLNEQIKRNQKRFPENFMFELTLDEWKSLRTQIATSKRQGIWYTPFAFTELWVAILRSVLNSDTAIEISMSARWVFIGSQLIALNHFVDRVR